MQFKRNKKLGVLRRPAHFFPNFLFVSSLDLQYNTVYWINFKGYLLHRWLYIIKFDIHDL